MSSSAITAPLYLDPTKAADGSAAAPSFAFANSTSTGIYRVSANTLGISTAGVQRVVVDANGNVGVGRASNLNSSASFRAIGLGGSSTLMSSTASGSSYMAQNLYFDGSVWRYLNTAAAGLYEMGSGGTHTWYTASSGTAGNAATNTQALHIENNGILVARSLIYNNSLANSTVGALNFLESAQNAAGYVTAIHWQSVQLGSGYRQHASLGSYRTMHGDFGFVYLGVGQNDNSLSTAYSFYGNGQAFQGNNSSTWATVSDIRIKQNIRAVSSCLEKITALNPVHFEYIDKPEKVKTGFIAQEFEQVLPGHVVEAVCSPEIAELKPELKDEKIKAIDADLIPYLVGAIKELSAKVDAQAEEIKALKAQP